MNSEFIDALFGYTSAMAIARAWLQDKIISQEEYEKLSEKIAKKYHVNLGSIMLEISG